MASIDVQDSQFWSVFRLQVPSGRVIEILGTFSSGWSIEDSRDGQLVDLVVNSVSTWYPREKMKLTSSSS